MYVLIDWQIKKCPQIYCGGVGIVSLLKKHKEYLMTKQFNGTINLDIRDSVPDWEPYAEHFSNVTEEVEVNGVLLAHGGRFGGHSFYIHTDADADADASSDRKLCYVYNWLGQQQQKISCPLPSPSNEEAKEVRLKVEFSKKPDKPEPTEKFGGSTRGEIKLYIDGAEQSATKDNTFSEYPDEFLTQPGKFALSGEGFNIGRDAGQPVSTDYQDEIPYEFEGAKLKKVIVTITNDADAIDYEKELRGMLMRD